MSASLNLRHALWRMLTSSAPPDTCQVELLSRLSPQALKALSVELDRLLLSSVKFGRPPPTIAEMLMSTREQAHDMSGPTAGFTEALWLAMTDTAFRNECFGDAAAALSRRGIMLSEQELGKFRWFDAEKLAQFGERMSLEMGKALRDGGRPSEASTTRQLAGAPWAEADTAAGLWALYEDHCAAIATIEREGARLAALEHSAVEDFDTGVPAPDYANFLNILHATRAAVGDPNAILLNTGYSFGRLLLLLQQMRRRKIELPPIGAAAMSDLPAAIDWFHQVSREGRPKLNETFHQSPCSPASVIHRVAHTARHIWLRDRKLLVLGDDDAISVALAKFTEAEVHVVDIDTDVLRYIKSCADKARVDLVLHEHDLRHPLPPALQGSFWLASADPPQSAPGTRFFLEQALAALHPMPGLRVYCSTTPMWLGREQVRAVADYVNSRGLVLHDVLKSAMRFYVNHPFDNEEALGKAGPLAATLMETLNMACDVHIYERA